LSTPGPAYAQTLQGNILSRSNMLLFIREFFRECQVEPGAYIEFGVLNGESMKQAYAALRGTITRFVGYDTFAGMPKLSEFDERCKKLHPRFEEANYKSAGREVIASYLTSTGMPAAQLELVAGDIRDVKPMAFAAAIGGPEALATVIHVDVDLHSSTLAALQLAVPHAADGCWFLFDDFWCYRGSPDCGVQRALREFEAANPGVAFTPYGNYNGWARAFLFHRRDTFA
jgi:hypothetical protein